MIRKNKLKFDTHYETKIKIWEKIICFIAAFFMTCSLVLCCLIYINFIKVKDSLKPLVIYLVIPIIGSIFLTTFIFTSISIVENRIKRKAKLNVIKNNWFEHIERGEIHIMKIRETYLEEVIAIDECSKCGEEECEIIYKFDSGLEINWYDCEPDDEAFNELVKLGVFEK